MKNLGILLGLLGVTTINHNTRKNGIEVIFKEPPSEDSKNFLKRNGFRWSSNKGLWYATYNSNLMTKVSEKFDDANNSKQELPKPTQSEIVVETGRKFEDKLKHQPWLNDAYQIVRQGVASFMNEKPRTVWLSATQPLTFDPKKNEYWYLPLKRKRPDYYPISTVYKILCFAVLKNGGIVDWNLIHSIEPIKTLWDYEYQVKTYPQQATAPNAEAFKNFFTQKDEYLKMEDARWKAWFETYSPNFKKAWVFDKNEWKQVTVNSAHRAYSDKRRDAVETQRGEGWITILASYPVDKIYLEPNGISLIEAYPQTITNTVQLRTLQEYLNQPTQPDKDKMRLRISIKARAVLALQMIEAENN